MFVGGQNKDKTNSPLKKAFLYSLFNPNDIETLEDIRLRREICSLSFIGGKSDQKVLAVGGFSNPSLSEY